MLVVDTSVWIDYLNNKNTIQTNLLNLAFDEDNILLPDLVLQEIIQGFKSEKEAKLTKKYLEAFEIVSVFDKSKIENYASNYRTLRKKGITIGTIDSIIASYCISNNLPLLFSDKDYNNCVKYLGLKNYAEGRVN
jgi:hypothetical protein